MDKMQEALTKMVGKRTLPLLIFVVLCLGLYLYSNSKYLVVDRMTNSNPYPDPMAASPASTNAKTDNVLPSTTDKHNDLLPKDVHSDWAKLNPVASSNIVGSDLLDSKAFMGQISQYKGIMNYDIRAAPVIEKREVSPWLQSTFEPDVNRTGIQLNT